MVQVWEGVHQFKSRQPAPCTALGVCRGGVGGGGGGGGGMASLVTGGEDGRINVLRLDSQQPLRVIGNQSTENVVYHMCVCACYSKAIS